MKYFRFLPVLLILMSLSDPTESEIETSELYARSLCLRVANLDIDTIYVIKCPDIFIPSEFEGYHIVDISDDPKSFLENERSLYAIKIFPIELNKGNIEIGLIDYGLYIENEELMLEFSGSEVFTYQYNSKNKRYKLINRQAYSI